MTFEEVTREAALCANVAVGDTMAQLESGRVKHEDDLTGVLVGALHGAMKGLVTGGVSWDCSILTHRSGTGGEEKKYGADLLIHVRMETPTQTYSKGVLVQAKRIEKGARMSSKDHGDLVAQCQKMLAITPAAFVFDYTASGMRCGSATRIAGTSDRELHATCGWTSYRFFLELFRCPIGDPRITSSAVDRLPVEHVLLLSAEGELSEGR